MYGLINRSIEELVRSSGGAELWAAVRDRAGVEVDHFEGMTTYDDDITYRLIDAAAAELGLEVRDVLERFGRYWVIYTGAEGWGPVLDSQGDSVLSVLHNLNDLHHRVRVSMPDLVMPTFKVRDEQEGSFAVEYHSERRGLAPMVLGLLRGLAERYGESWSVSQIGLEAIDGFDTFLLVADVRDAPGAGPDESRLMS